jgi:hypothetical protein
MQVEGHYSNDKLHNTLIIFIMKYMHNNLQDKMYWNTFI